MARGRAEILGASAPDGLPVRLGGTVFRLLGETQEAALQAGVEYRLYYVPGPAPMIVSAEVVGGADAGAALLEGDPGPGAGPDPAVRRIRRGQLLVVLIGLLALGLPVAGILASRLPENLRGPAWLLIVAVAVGFVPFARWWLGASGKSSE
jgi:hypothetical protein